MSQEIVMGNIVSIEADGLAHIVAPVPNLEKAMSRDYRKVMIGFCDGRHISPEQRKKCYALIHEIADWVGDYDESVKQTMKMEFVLNRLQGMQRKVFSLADVDMNTASEFISYLVEFVLIHDIPCQGNKLADLCEDIGKYVYACLLNKKCCVCGGHADLHHIDAVGMGNDRQEAHHLGREALPLCREHHTEAHAKGNNDFINKYHLQSVKIDEAICKKYKLKR